MGICTLTFVIFYLHVIPNLSLGLYFTHKSMLLVKLTIHKSDILPEQILFEQK